MTRMITLEQRTLNLQQFGGMLKADLKSKVALYINESKAFYPLKCDTMLDPSPGSHLTGDAFVFALLLSASTLAGTLAVLPCIG